MKSIRKIFGSLFILGVFIALLSLLHAQESALTVQEIQPIGKVQPDSVVRLTAESEGLEPVSRENLPENGTFWVVTPENGVTAPWPCAPRDASLPIYAISDGQFIVDATGGKVSLNTLQDAGGSLDSALEALANSVGKLINWIQGVELTRQMAVAFGMEEELASPSGFAPMMMVFEPGSLFLELTNVANGLADLNLHNGTNQVYAIWSTTNLPDGWQVEREVWPTNSEVMPFTVPTQGRETLFVRAEDWTGVDSNADGIPDWWAWQYFGTASVAGTNLDFSGNGYTFAQDYSNNITPTVFKYSGLEVPNNYVSSSQPAVQMDVAGTPYYVATLIDDNNFSNAVWNTYSGSTVTVNLGSVQGWHEVWIGLRAHADDPTSAMWQRKRLKQDWTPPALFITNPTNTTVDIPMIQLQGFSPEALSSISYDLTNAAGLVTNQQILVLNQYYDANTSEFTTNTWQAFDVVLTNGVNTFIFHATDLAGNVTTASYNLTVDYSAKTNPPSVQITWPQPGTEVSGSSFTVDGQVSDATVTVAATITDTNGNTNTVNSLVERTGKFWVENMPLNSGTNTVTLTVTDAAGNSTTNSFNVVQSAVTLTVDAVGDPQQLWQPTVNLTGTISDTSYAVWVNGVKGTNNGDGTWSANNVPVNSGGTASFTATGYAPTEQQSDGSYGN